MRPDFEARLEGIILNGRIARRKILRIPIAYLYELLLGGRAGGLTVAVFSGVPDTAQAVGLWEHHQSGCVDLVLEDPSFPETVPGAEHPFVEIQWNHIPPVAPPVVE